MRVKSDAPKSGKSFASTEENTINLIKSSKGKGNFELKYFVDEVAISRKALKNKLSKSKTASTYETFLYSRDFMALIKSWDRGTRKIREDILEDFIKYNKGKSGAELENELSGGASLFLTRINAWLRLTYLFGNSLATQISAIKVFVTSAGGTRFLNEFLESGGLFTLLEILSITQSKEVDKLEAIHLIHDISNLGIKFREFICECYGIRAITDYLGKAKSDAGAEFAKETLLSLGNGIIRYLPQVYKSFVSLITNNQVAPKCLAISCQGLRMLIPSISPLHSSIVDSCIVLLRNSHYQVQYEGCLILKDLVQRSNLQDIILIQLINRLKTVVDVGQDALLDKNNDFSSDAEDGRILEVKGESMMATYNQQACCARLLGVIAVESIELAEKMVELQCVGGLLSAISNVSHTESQRNAVDTLLHLIDLFPRVADVLKEEVGEEFYLQIKNSQDTFFKDLTKDQIRYLNRNSLNMKTLGKSHSVEDTNFIEQSESAILAEYPKASSEAKPSQEDDDAASAEGEKVAQSQEDTETKKYKEFIDDSTDLIHEEKEAELKAKSVYVPFSIPSFQTSLIGSKIQTEQDDQEGEEISLGELLRSRRIDCFDGRDKRITKASAAMMEKSDLNIEVLQDDLERLITLREEPTIFKKKVESEFIEKQTTEIENKKEDS